MRRSTHLLNSFALTPRSEFATNEDTSGDTGLTLPGGSVKGILEAVVAHGGYYREGISSGAETFPNDTGLYAHLQKLDLNIARPRGQRSLCSERDPNLPWIS